MATFVATTVFVVVSGVAAVASPVPQASPELPAAAADAMPSVASPSVTPTEDGAAIQGSWSGPFQLQSLHSNKCLDMGNSTANFAGATQWTCQSGRNTQKWWVWETYADCCVTISYLYNAHSGMCLNNWNAHQAGAQLVQGPCQWNETELWLKSGGVTSGFWSFTSQYNGFCMDVGGSSMANGAAIIQWDCKGNAEQKWAEQQY
jgi:hypothetical protein